MKHSRRTVLKAMGLSASIAGMSGYSSGNVLADSSSTEGYLPQLAKAGGTVPVCSPFVNDTNSLFQGLPTCCIGEPLAEGEMRITFLGTSCTPMRSQEAVSVYVEVGPTQDVPAMVPAPLDYVMFDCGIGCLANYIAAGIPYQRMDKIFLAHLHADHMSELSAIYCFGESADRKSPLYVWGPSKSGVVDPVSGEIHEDGTKAIMGHFREVCRWHTESFSFTYNGYTSYDPNLRDKWGLPVDPVPVGPMYQQNSEGKPIGNEYADPPNDSYAIVPIELDWTKSGEVEGDNIAYWNKETGLKVTHFPAIHCRKGSISYKVEWTSPHTGKTLSMIYSGDTRPNYTMMDKAGGVDVLVHEIVMPPDKWTMKFLHTDDPSDIDPNQLAYFTDIQNSSHTTQGAFGYLLSQIKPWPRLTVATHFQATDDTIECAIDSVDSYLRKEYPSGDLPSYTFASDFTVVKVTGDKVLQYRMPISSHEYPYGGGPIPQPYDIPKYNMQAVDEDGNPEFDAKGNPILIGDPEAQLLLDDAILAGDNTYSEDCC